jgi:tetratricopeptide (TPR) repeat protein
LSSVLLTPRLRPIPFAIGKNRVTSLVLIAYLALQYCGDPMLSIFLLRDDLPRRAESTLSGRLAPRNISLLGLLAVLLLFLPAVLTAAQTPATGQIKGTVTDESKPLPGVVVSLANVHAGKSFKIKTDDFGRFVLQDAPYGYYDLEIVGTDGDRLLQQQLSIIPAGTSQTATVNIDVSRSKTTSAPGDPAVYGGLRTLPEPNIKNKKEKNKEIARQNEKISEMNVLILQANAAALSGKWQEAVAPLQQLTAMDPDGWEYFSELGDVQSHLGEYRDALGSYETGLLNAGEVSGINVETADAESVRKKTGVSHMLNNKGIVYSKLHRTKEAMAAYSRSAALASDPSLTYFNLCVTQYNLKNVEGTVAACDKAVSVDPGKAEAHYFKGALLLYANQPAVTGKVTAPPAGTAEALKKYLELAPNGEHAAEVREMLEYLAVLTKNAENGNRTNKN